MTAMEPEVLGCTSCRTKKKKSIKEPVWVTAVAVVAFLAFAVGAMGLMASGMSGY